MEDRLDVHITNREGSCVECKENISTGDMVSLSTKREPRCLSCVDLDHLVFLPSGNNALTVRSKKYSKLYAVVYKFSKARKRNERQGLLVEKQALEKAEQECLGDAEIRARRQVREGERRVRLDQEYVRKFKNRIIELFPGCPSSQANEIAEHACLKYSGRVGRSASAKNLDESSVTLAVRAHIRHALTDYDEFLSRGYDREHARTTVADKVDEIDCSWRKKDKTSSVPSVPLNKTE